MVTASNWMTRKLVTLDADACLADALMLTRRNRIRHIPIVKDGKLVGIVSDRDTKNSIPNVLGGMTKEKFEATITETRMHQVMRTNPVTVKPETPIAEVVELMLSKGIGCLPVVDGDELAGIITQTDLMKLLLFVLRAQSPTRQA